MPTPREHKTVQVRILEYAEAIGWKIVSRKEAEQWRDFDPAVPPADRAKNRSLLHILMTAKTRVHELEIAHTFNSWGGTLVQLERPDAALDCFKEARDIYRKYEAENKVGLAETLTNLSLAHHCLGKKNEASLALQEALDVAKSGGDRDQVRRIEIATIQLDPSLIEGDPLRLLDDAANEAITDGRYSTGCLRQCIRATVAEDLENVSDGLAACEDARAIEHLLDPGDPTPANMRLVHGI